MSDRGAPDVAVDDIADGGFDDDGFEDDADPWLYPAQTVIEAASATPVRTAAPRSVFELAQAVATLKACGRFGNAAGFETTAPPTLSSVTKAGDVTRCSGSRYPSSRWTEERFEQERVRRAKQRPPRPTKRAKSRGRKLLDLIGPEESDA